MNIQQDGQEKVVRYRLELGISINDNFYENTMNNK